MSFIGRNYIFYCLENRIPREKKVIPLMVKVIRLSTNEVTRYPAPNAKLTLSVVLLHLLLHLRKVRDDGVSIVILSNHRWGDVLFPSSFVYPSIDDNDTQLVMILQNSDVLKWVSIDQDAVSIKSFLNSTQFVFSHEKLGNSGCGCNYGFHGCETEQLDKVFEIPSICPMGRPCKSIVAARKNNDTPSMHLSESSNRSV